MTENPKDKKHSKEITPKSDPDITVRGKRL